MLDKKKRHRGRRLILVLYLLLPSLAACQQTDQENVSDLPMTKEKWKPLTIVGYNYTNLPINDFRVNGIGGGNIHISDYSSGGGGNVCCVNYIIGLAEWRPVIKWQHGGCEYAKTASGSTMAFSRTHFFYKEEHVLVSQTIPQNPEFIEVHFYPDGHVEIALTENASSPRLKLDSQRTEKQQFEMCPDDKRPNV